MKIMNFIRLSSDLVLRIKEAMKEDRGNEAVRLKITDIEKIEEPFS